MKKQRYALYKKILLVSETLFSLFFLVCCITPFVEPDHFILLTYASILFPYCLAAFLLWLLVTLFFFRRYSWIFFLLLIPAWKNAAVVISLHLQKPFSNDKQPGQLRILSWNVNNFLYTAESRPGFAEKQDAMVSFIRSTNADILCFQDYSEVPIQFGKVNIAFIRDSLQYPYYYFSNDGANYGTAIFSRLPITDTGHIKYSAKIYSESLAFADVLYKEKKLRIYNTHLKSMFLHSDKLYPWTIGYGEFVKEDTAFLFHSTRLERMVHFDSVHTEQAKLVKTQLNKTTTPFIFCADLNSVPSTYVYQHIKQGLHDAFLEAGSGLGGTYHRFTLTLRIDVVLLSPSINATQYFSPQPDLSDHYPLITDIHLRN